MKQWCMTLPHLRSAAAYDKHKEGKHLVPFAEDLWRDTRRGRLALRMRAEGAWGHHQAHEEARRQRDRARPDHRSEVRDRAMGSGGGSLLADGCLCGMGIGALRPRGAALLGTGTFDCPCCGSRNVNFHHPYTECQVTATQRLQLMEYLATNITRLSGTKASASNSSARIPSVRGPGHLGPERNAHVIQWGTTFIKLLTPEQWAALPPDSTVPRLSVAATWTSDAPEVYAAGGIQRPKIELLPLWARACARYLEEVTSSFWPTPPSEEDLARRVTAKRVAATAATLVVAAAAADPPA
eukprot:gene17535-65614_t